MTATKKSRGSSGGVLDFLQSAIPRKALQGLYQEEPRGQFVCRAVLQQLSATAQQVVMRLQCSGGSFPLANIQVWTCQTPKQLDLMIQEMQRWGILERVSANEKLVSLTGPFKAGLQASLCSLDASPWKPLEPVQLEALAHEAGTSAVAASVSAEFLERYTQEQWDAVLHKLVGTPGQKEPPESVIGFLSQTGLMRPDPEGRDIDKAKQVITESGYEFMLQDNHQQVWQFVLQYIRLLEKNEGKGEALRNEALLFLISLSFAKVGGAYLASALNKTCRTMMKDLSQFGLIYIRKIGKATLFYPTRVAHQLVGTSSSSAGTSTTSTVWSLSNKALEASLADPRPSESSHLAIIVQTNFQLCAYTTSELHVSMLSLFCDENTIRRLPNVVFMSITRDAVKNAFKRGIQARQILRFLEKHTHPKLRTPENTSPVPANVVDQIWLWDRELSRVRFTKVYQHSCLMGAKEFKAVLQYAEATGAHAWSSERQYQLLLDYRYFERIQTFVQQWRAQAVSRQQRD